MMSGSSVIAACISSSVIVRKRFQSVAGSPFEVAPEVSSFMRFGPPGRDDAPLVGFAIAVNHHNFEAVHKTDGVHPQLAVIDTIIGPFDRRPIKDPRRILKRDPVSTNV